MRILGISTSGARTTLTQAHSASLAVKALDLEGTEECSLRELYRLSTIQSRHTVLGLTDGDHGTAQHIEDFFPSRTAQNADPTTANRLLHYTDFATELACSVASGALKQASLEPTNITHLVTVSCTGFEAPGFDFNLIRALKLPAEVQRTHVGFMGCNAALNGMRVARAFAAQGAKVLLVCVELCSLHFSYGSNADQMVANSLFSDGAAALVIGPQSENSSQTSIGEIVGCGSAVIPNSEDAMKWRVTDHGFKMSLSPKVPVLIERALIDLFPTWLEKHKLSVSTIGGWAIHPGGPRVLDSVKKALELSDLAMKPSRDILTRHGNMSSPTILFVVEELARTQVPYPWIMMAFGPGLVAEFALVRS